jgi:copper chaperone
MQQYNLETNQAVADLWETRTFGIDGMTCDNCVKTVTKALKRVSGVKDVSVQREDATATVTFDTTKTDMPALHDALLKAGYTPKAGVAE